MSIIQKISDKLTSGNKMQYILIGTLVLVIVISLISGIMGTGGKRRGNYKPRDMHFFCMETEKEFVLTPENIKKMIESKRKVGTPMPDMMGGADMFVESPYTNQKTGVPMKECPNCKKYYVPGYIKAMYHEETPTKKQMKTVCPHCGTNFQEWHKKNRKKK